jgi:5-amino-6-(5-phosphoribosylamino)uracil reductase
MAKRPYVLLSAAMSLDGYIDDASGTRLLLSGQEDLDRVDELRASCDAILVGAGTIRRDNPALLVRSPARRAGRAARGLDPSPVRVTVSSGGNLDPAARFFAGADSAGADSDGADSDGEPGTGGSGRLVYVAGPAAAGARERLGGVATVVGAGDPLSLAGVLADLAARGVGRLLVEGGSQILTQFLACSLADELLLAVAPFLVGDPAAPRLAGAGTYPYGPGRRMVLAGVSQLGDMSVLRYLLSGQAVR